MKKILTLIYILAIIAAAATILPAYENGALDYNQTLRVTGAPGDIGTCNYCHSTYSNNSQSGSISILFNNGNNTYKADSTYTIQVQVTGSTINKYGFQMTALTDGDTMAGQFLPAPATDTFFLQTTTSSGVYRRYIEQSIPSTTGIWTFQWVAPDSMVGNIKFYASGVAAQFPTGSGGDKTFSTVLNVQPLTPPVVDFNQSDTMICAGDTINFDAYVSTFANLEWSFQGGNPATSQVDSPSVVFSTPGLYTVSLKATNEAGADSVEKVQLIQVNPNPTINFASTDLTCYGEPTGSLTAIPSGAQQPYTYSWSTDTLDTLSTITSLFAGSYCVTVTDTLGCLSFACDTVSQPAELEANLSNTNVDCYGDSTATATANPAGGTGPYNFLWQNGEMTSSVSGLPAGFYYVTITDANGCQMVDYVNVLQPTQIVYTIDITPETAAGNAAIDVNVSGGNPGYNYSWSTGAQTQDLTGITAGSYSLTITDASGCSKAVTISVPSYVGIDDPEEIALEIFPNPAASVLNLSLKGEASLIQLMDASGREVKQMTNVNGRTSLDVSALPEGFYLVHVHTEKGILSRKVLVKK